MLLPSRYVRLAIFAIAASALLSLSHAQAFEVAGKRAILFENADYHGHDIRHADDVTLDECRRQCLAEENCRAFTYNRNAQRCFVKSDFGALRTFAGAVAGRIVKTSGDGDSALPPLDFVPSSTLAQAEREKSRIASRPVDPAESFMGLQSRAAGQAASGDYRAAMESLLSALALAPEDHDTWMMLAELARATAPENYSDRLNLRSRAISAAVNAYGTAPTSGNQADALAMLARTLADGQLYRPALEAYKASLLIRSSRSVQAEYEALAAQHGFRVVNHTVDSDTASPRICVQFSEPLAGNARDFSQFVTLNERVASSVSVDGHQVCVDGLTHGETYRIGLRAGLPSTVGETLGGPVALQIYVRDRSPGARFTGRNFVLPSAGEQRIPVVTVNTEALEMELYRIGERGLAGIVDGRRALMSQLDDYAAESIDLSVGEKLWSGVLEVAKELNREVTTSFPVDEILPTDERRPGVYIMRARPSEAAPQPWSAQATQWFIVSDIGLTTLQGADGLHVFARSLSDASPLAGVRLGLTARSNEILASTATDSRGHAVFAPGLLRGRGGNVPVLVSAEDDQDFAFIDLTQPAFDLSDRGVEGRSAPGPIDVFLYTERGIYRPGETIHVVGLTRDDGARAIAGIPLTFKISRPDGKEHLNRSVPDSGLGAHLIDAALPANAMRGAWRITVHADPDRPAIAETAVLVEDFLPERLDLEIESPASLITPDEPLAVNVTGRYLYGAPAAGLRLEGEITMRPVRALAAYPRYSFGLDADDAVAYREQLEELPVTDKDGTAAFDVRVSRLLATTRPLEASIGLRLRESSGRAIERVLTLPVASPSTRIGIRPEFEGGRVGEGETAAFSVIAVNPAFERTTAASLSWQLERLERSFQWYQTDGTWNYEAVTYTTRVDNGRIDIPPDRTARIDTAVDWGRYRLTVETPDGSAASSVEFSAGWYVEARTADTPDILDIALDRARYKVGDTATVSITPRFAGTAQVHVMSDRLIAITEVDVPEEGTTIQLTVSEDWGPGAYVTALLYRPGDTQARRMPARAIGLNWFSVDQADRSLTVSFDVDDVVRPDGPFNVPLTVNGLRAGEEAYVTLAAVDVGILNLTRYEAPDPAGWYYGQRRLGMELRDLYGRLIDSYRGAPGRIRTGGDAVVGGMEGSPPTQPLVAEFSGLVTVAADGKATVQFELPQFNGTVRLMAVAWTSGAVGHGSRDVVVRDPVVVTANLPRFLAPGDSARMLVELDNTDGPAGDYTLFVDATDGLHVADGERRHELRLAENGRASLAVLIAAERAGTGAMTLTLAGPDGFMLSQSRGITVRPARPPASERNVVAMPAYEGRLVISDDVLAGFLPETASVDLSIMRTAALDVPALLMSLDRYPYGCAEQITSRALPLLYLNQVATRLGLGDDGTVRDRVREAIASLVTFQASNGSFGLWGPGNAGRDLWLDAYVTDFLTRAREKGYEVPANALRLALEALQNRLAYAPDINNDGEDIAYALYALARNRAAAIGDLRYYGEARLDHFGSPLAKAQIGAALALYGEGQRADRAFAAAVAMLGEMPAAEPFSRADYGSRLRDTASILTLVAESGRASVSEIPLLTLIAQSQEAEQSLSTQEQAWLLMAAHGLMQEGENIALEVNGYPADGNLFRRYTSSELAGQPFLVANRSERTLDAVLTVTGVPERPRPAGGDGFTITRQYYSMAGEPVSVEAVGQNERFVVVLKVIETNRAPSRLLIEDWLPAGFEIDNPSLVQSADLVAFDWLPNHIDTAHTEFRDDRFAAAFDRSPGDDREILLAYVVRAVTPGRFTHPPAMVEDMYRPNLAARTAEGEVEVIAPSP